MALYCHSLSSQVHIVHNTYHYHHFAQPHPWSTFRSLQSRIYVIPPNLPTFRLLLDATTIYGCGIQLLSFCGFCLTCRDSACEFYFVSSTMTGLWVSAQTPMVPSATPHFGCNVFRKLPHIVLVVVDRHPPSVLAIPHFLIILLISFVGHLLYGKSK